MIRAPPAELEFSMTSFHFFSSSPSTCLFFPSPLSDTAFIFCCGVLRYYKSTTLSSLSAAGSASDHSARAYTDIRLSV